MKPISCDLDENVKEFEEAIRELWQYINQEQFEGYDPYDGLNSKIGFTRLGRWPAICVTQILKWIPLNARPILGIKKELHPKALGLLLHACSILHEENT